MSKTQAPDPAQVAPVSLLEAIDYALNQAPCECPHSMRFERGEHMSGCYLFDLNVEYAKTAPAILAPEGGESDRFEAWLNRFIDQFGRTPTGSEVWQARAALAAPAPQAPAWQPIETAPKDGTPVDLWRGEWKERATNMRRVQLEHDNVFYESVFAGPACVRDATHWMPLPAAPQAKEQP